MILCAINKIRLGLLVKFTIRMKNNIALIMDYLILLIITMPSYINYSQERYILKNMNILLIKIWLMKNRKIRYTMSLKHKITHNYIKVIRPTFLKFLQVTTTRMITYLFN